ncbi:hypothetical protein EDB92DRAFT_2116328 [Lactarius akahatsu]|uniref:BTB domain-containing protein n=1 Tax=Lactarius akahatsu TaxID=416441 RepID=A0AAD4Q8H1_9AGAM|nr:hypothetical protein EDB92DRAFT_2116328 [Lactarius akahatsu]
MTPHIVSWSDNEIFTSPVLSSAASIISFDSTFSDTYLSHSQMSPTASKAPGLHIAHIGAKYTTFLEFSENPGGGHATPDDSFIRHDAYFFKDGNVTFLVGGTLYCVHRYFFSRDSVYFSTRLSQLGIRDHEALPTIISIGDIERKDFEALLSVLYPTNFEAHELTYEQWNLSHPPHPTINEYLRALIQSTTGLDEAQQMSMEDVVLVARVREEIRGGVLRVDAADIRHHIEVAQAGKPSRPVGDEIHWDTQKNGATGPKSNSTVALAIDPNVEAEIAEATEVTLPSGPQQSGMKEGDTPKEVPDESPGVELPDVVVGTPQDYLKKNVTMSDVQTGGTRKLEVALPKVAALSLAKAAFAENHAVRDMAGQEAEENANVETMRRIEAEAPKERADAEEKAREVQKEAVRARERAYAEAKKAAVEARKAPLIPQVPAIPTHRIDPPPATGDPREEWCVDFLAVRATESTGVRFFSWVGNKSVFPTTSEVSTASTMSASGLGTPADGLPAVTEDSREEGRWLVSRTGERRWFPNDTLGDLQHIFALLTTGWRYA